MHDERADGVEHRHDGDGEQRRVGAIAPGRLAVASDPEAGEREQERREAERAEAGDVDQEAGPEAGDGAEDRALCERDGDEGDEHEVGRAPRIPIEATIVTWRIATTKKSAAVFAIESVICGRGLSLARTSTTSSE